MNKEIKRILKTRAAALEGSGRTMREIYEIMFSDESLVMCEKNDGFRTRRYTYGDIKRRVERAAASLFDLAGEDGYIALACDNNDYWIVGFFAILMSGNKPYLVNLRYPDTLTNGILKRLEIKYILTDAATSLDGESVVISELEKGEVVSDCSRFCDEFAFSSSATSMNEVICFYTGAQVSAQVLCFKSIVRKNPDIAAHYKGSLKQLAFLPFYHVFGLFAVFFWFCFFGRTLVFLRDLAPDTILKTVKRHGVTHIFAVPLLWHTVEKSVLGAVEKESEKKQKKFKKGLKLATALQNAFPGVGPALARRIMREVTSKVFGDSVRFCISGGSYLKDSALSLINGIGYPLYNGYGMSEIGITSVELRRKAKHRNENSVGRPFDAAEYFIDDNGILQVKTKTVCVKKLVNGKEMHFEGVFDTGDCATVNNGNYFLVGRQSDVVIGENGENINPDTVEKTFDIKDAVQYCVLGLDDELSLVVGLGRYVTQAAVDGMIADIYAQNGALDPATAVRRFYFTYDPLASEGAIKVSRSQLKSKIDKGEVTLVPFSNMRVKTEGDGVSSPLMEDVKEVIAGVLNIDASKIGANTHIFFDLDATSLQYFSILTELSKKFELTEYDKSEKYCYTPKEICEFLERYL